MAVGLAVPVVVAVGVRERVWRGVPEAVVVGDAVAVAVAVGVHVPATAMGVRGQAGVCVVAVPHPCGHWLGDA